MSQSTKSYIDWTEAGGRLLAADLDDHETAAFDDHIPAGIGGDVTITPLSGGRAATW